MTRSWTIRPTTIADTESIVDLRNEVHGSQVRLAEWHWRYSANPAGESWLFVAEDAGKIIGHVGRIRIWINVSGERLLAAHTHEVSVDPGYRRRGVGLALAAQADAAQARAGIPIRLGLATAMGRKFMPARPGEGRYKPGNVVRLLMVLNPRAMVEKRTGSSLLAALCDPPTRLLLHLWAGRKRKSRGAEDITIETVDSFDSRFDELWSSIKDDLPLGLWQDAEYLNWRYRACPAAEHTVLAARKEESLLGFIVLKWGDEERYRLGEIVDFLFAPQELHSARALVSAAASYFEDEGADAITCDIFGRGSFYRLLRSRGFLRRRQGLLFTIKLDMPDLPHTLLADPRNWYFMENLY